MTLLLNPRLWLALLLAGVLVFTNFASYRAGRSAVRTQWDAATVASERAAQEQASRMRELQRAAELKYVVQAEARDRFYVTTVREIHDAAAPLADCRLPDAVRLRLNDAAACARDSAAAGCAAGQVPDAR